MKKTILPNGLTILHKQQPSNAVTIQVLVNVGSNHEKDDERGICHFIEHMVFEGTKKRPTNWELSNEIEKLGGEFNAYTTNERTCFYIKILNKHFPKAVEILSDILCNSQFEEKILEKEKKVVIKEIDMVHDEPRYYQWDILQQNIFKNNPAKYPVYGSKKVIKSLTRDKVLNFYNKHYNANNIIVSVVGNVKGWKDLVEKNFIFNNGKKNTHPLVREIVMEKSNAITLKKDITSTYAVLGFRTVPVTHKDFYTLEVINAILGRGQSGRIFTELRSKNGLGYDVGTQNINEISFGYFAVYISLDNENLNKAKEMIIKELDKLQEIKKDDLKDAITFIEGDYLLDIDDTQKIADLSVFYEQTGNLSLLDTYLKNIKKVTIEDVKKVAKKYFNKYTFAVIKGK